MTTKEIVLKLVKDIQSLPDDAPISGEDLVQDAIEQAIQAERERCAKVADEWAADGDCCRGIAAQIRAAV